MPLFASFQFLLFRSAPSDSGDAADYDGVVEPANQNLSSQPSSPCSVQSRFPKSPSSANPPSQQPPTPPLKETRQNSLLRLRLPLVSSFDHSQDATSPNSVRDVKDKILASSKSILGKVLSPSKEKFNDREKVRIYCIMEDLDL